MYIIFLKQMGRGDYFTMLNSIVSMERISQFHWGYLYGTKVVGGVAADEFLASVEQLDSSNKEDVLYQVLPHKRENKNFTLWFPRESGEWWRRLSRCPDMTLPWLTSRPAGGATLTFNNSSSFSQAGHKLNMQEALGHNLDPIFTVQIALRNISVHPKTRHVETVIWIT